VHPDQAPDLDLVLRALVEDEQALLDLALVHAHVGQLAVPALLELEREADEREIGVRLDDDLLALVVTVELSWTPLFL
jgi:hypothetical protein